MIKITNEVDGKKYELVKSDAGCEQCDFQESCSAAPCWYGMCLCLILEGIWKEVRDADVQ